MATKQILDLDDLTELPTVKIDGQSYPMRTFGQLAPIELHRIQSMSARHDDLVRRVLSAEADALQPDEVGELETLPDRMCRVLLIAPEDVYARLSDGNRMRVVKAFFDMPRLLNEAAAKEQEPTTTEPETGVTSSLDSLASTVATH